MSGHCIQNMLIKTYDESTPNFSCLKWMSLSWSSSWTLWRRYHTGQVHFKSRNLIPKIWMCTEFGDEKTEERVAVASRNPEGAWIPLKVSSRPAMCLVSRVLMRSPPDPAPAPASGERGLCSPRAHPSTAPSKVFWFLQQRQRLPSFTLLFFLSLETGGL